MPISRVDASLNTPVLNKDKTVSRVSVFTAESGKQHYIRHGLGIIPQDIYVSECEGFCRVKTITKDNFRALVEFDAPQTYVTLKFEV